MHICFYLPNVRGGGAERVTLVLCEELAQRGHEVTLLLDHYDGEYVADIVDSVRVVELVGGSVSAKVLARQLRCVGQSSRALLNYCMASRKPWFTLVRTTRLADFLKTHACDVLVAALGYAPFIAYWANRMASDRAQVVSVEHTTPSRVFLVQRLTTIRLIRLNQIKNLMRRVYPHLSAIVAVSDGVAEDTTNFVQLERKQARTIYNPVSVDRIQALSLEAGSHSWVADESRPLLVAAGRLVAPKNFRLLLDAFSCLKCVESRLVILGSGPLNQPLLMHAQKLGISQRVDFVGWRDNPYAFMKRANVFVQSSDREGFGMALVEALACGCPVVATDCLSGPREILDHGRFGKLVPVHDAAALAEAIDACLSKPPGNEKARIARASEFSVTRSVDAYESLFRELVTDTASEPKSGRRVSV